MTHHHGPAGHLGPLDALTHTHDGHTHTHVHAEALPPGPAPRLHL